MSDDPQLRLYELNDSEVFYCSTHISAFPAKTFSHYVEVSDRESVVASCPMCPGDEYREPVGYRVGEAFVCPRHLDDLSPTGRMIAKVEYDSLDGPCHFCAGGKGMIWQAAVAETEDRQARAAIPDHSPVETLVLRDRALTKALEIMRLDQITQPTAEKLIEDATKIEAWLTR